MKQKPPRYTLDPETRRLCELVVYWARQLESVQQPPLDNDMMSVIYSVEQRLGLMPPTDDLPQTPAEVVPLRPFRVIETNKSEHTNEPR
jgi:hypothetical protein